VVRSHRRGASQAWTLCLLLMLTGTIAGSYFALRYAGGWSDSDTGSLSATIASVADEGTLLTSGGAYSMGFAYQSLSVFIISLTGLHVTQLQFQVYPLIAGMVIVLAFAMYRALTGSAVAGALATLLLLLQPDFLFVVFRGSHEKVTWLGAMLATYLLARSFRAVRQPGRLASYVGLFYLAAFTLIASNAFFGSSFIVAAFVGLAAGLFLGYLSERRPPPGAAGLPVGRLTYVVASALVLWYLMVFYLYPAATRFLYDLRTTVDRAGAVTAGLEQRFDVAGSVGQGWVSRTAYLGVTSPTWVLAVVSFLVWVALALRMLRRRRLLEAPPQLLLWLLYGGFGMQLAVGLFLARFGGAVANLQVRLFPAVMLMACALVAVAIHAGWRRWTTRFKRSLLTIVLLAFALWAGIAAPLKMTNEASISTLWNFWTPFEEHAVWWADDHATQASIWLGPSPIRIAGRARAAEFGGRTGNDVDSTVVEPQTRDLVISDAERELARRIAVPLPDVRHENRVYDNGGTQMYHKRARTPFQY